MTRARIAQFPTGPRIERLLEGSNESQFARDNEFQKLTELMERKKEADEGGISERCHGSVPMTKTIGGE